MNDLQPEAEQQIENQLKLNERHSPAIRLWHWLTFITLSASLITVLLGSTMFRTKNNITLVQEQLQGKGGSATIDQARAVAHEYADKLWHTHKYIGYGMVFLLLSRMVIECTQPSNEKLKGKLSRMLRLQFVTSGQKANRSHYIWVQSGYLIFYFFILVMAVTGMGLAYEDVPFFRSIHQPLGQIHLIFQYGIYAYILFHITGVLLAETNRFPGLVSRMIGGKKKVSE